MLRFVDFIIEFLKKIHVTIILVLIVFFKNDATFIL
jgi:hypothetical protein